MGFLRVSNARVLACLVLVVLLALTRIGQASVLTIDSPLKSSAESPVADGVINPGEYGAPFFVSFQGDSNPGRIFLGANPPTSDADLSYELYTAHTSTHLFFGFRVWDDFIDAQVGDALLPFLNDGVELFLDADHVSNDLIPNTWSGSTEGFQIISDTLTNQYTTASVGTGTGDPFTNADWTVAAGLLSDGYIIEFMIPLALLDTLDGPGSIPATTGSTIRFNVGVTDNDALVSAQSTYGMLWSENTNTSPFASGEPVWFGELRLVPEPSTFALVGIGVLGLGWASRRRAPGI